MPLERCSRGNVKPPLVVLLWGYWWPLVRSAIARQPGHGKGRGHGGKVLAGLIRYPLPNLTPKVSLRRTLLASLYHCGVLHPKRQHDIE